MSARCRSIDLNELRSQFDYDPDIGFFRRKSQPSTIITLQYPNGYIRVCFNKISCSAHRLAWFYYYGEWPSGQIDHINGNKTDNRIANLRDVSSRQNGQNKKIHRSGRLPGAIYRKWLDAWQARIWINGISVHLGVFKTEQEAHNAYLAAQKKIESGIEVRSASTKASA
jgi:hypothetical protein